LNNLTGKEWLKFTKSWFIHRPPKRKEDEILHPAKYPESLIEEFILFFTKKNEWVLDPFMGTGSTLIAAASAGRNAVGIELNKNYFRTSAKRIKNRNFRKCVFPINGNSENLLSSLSLNGFENKLFNYIITSPPYWNQLKRNSIRQKEREQKKLDTKYSTSKDDIGNIDSYETFLDAQAKIFDQVYDVTINKGYLTIITNNVYFNSRLYPLAFDTAISLTNRGSKSWVLKDEKIWLQDDKRLIALGVNSAWVGNRHHQYCLIFRKEN
jgi:DNA modification methylase